jgi:hypothetical protein
MPSATLCRVVWYRYIEVLEDPVVCLLMEAAGSSETSVRFYNTAFHT